MDTVIKAFTKTIVMPEIGLAILQTRIGITAFLSPPQLCQHIKQYNLLNVNEPKG